MNRCTWKLFITILALVIRVQSSAQQITGKVVDGETNQVLAGTSVKISNETGLYIRWCKVDEKGVFRFKVEPGNYTIAASYIGYKTEFLKVGIEEKKNYTITAIKLFKTAKQLNKVTVKSRKEILNARKDTIEFAADKLISHENSTLKGLIENIPGLTIKDGLYNYQGKKIEEIFIEGKTVLQDQNGKSANPDKLATMLSGNIISKIQIIDVKDNQKAMNITIRDENKNILNGTLSTGGGSNERYNYTGNFQFINKKKILLSSISGNNINTNRNVNTVSEEDPGNAQVGQLTNTAVWGNYNLTIGPTTQFAISLNDSYSNTENQSVSDKQYLAQSDHLNTYTQSNIEKVNLNHSLSLHISGIKLNDKLTLSVSLDGAKGSERVKSNTEYNIYAKDTTNNTSHAYNVANTSGYGASIRMAKQIGTHGAMIYFDGRFRQQDMYSDNKSNTKSTLNGGNTIPIYEEIIMKNKNTSSNYSFQAAYTKPLSDVSSIGLMYGITLTDSKGFTKFNMNNHQIDSLSNGIKSQITSNYAGFEFSSSWNKCRLKSTVTFNGIRTDIYGISHFQTNQVYIYPAIFFNYNFTDFKSFKFDVHGLPSVPSPNNFINIVKLTDPTNKEIGNPLLKAGYSITSIAGYNAFKTNGTTFTATGEASIKINQILPETTMDSMGKQTTKQININGGKHFNGSISYGKPFFRNIFTLGYDGNIDYDITPTSFNSQFIKAKSITLSNRISTTITIKNVMEWRAAISQALGWTKFKKEDNVKEGTNLSTATLSLSQFYCSAVFFVPEGITIGGSLNLQKVQDINQTSNLLNFWIAKSFLKYKQLTLKLLAFDILDQNKFIQRSTTSIFIDSYSSSTLQQYLMLSAIYIIGKKHLDIPKR
ncbi:carboxypeptidase regulatory-like domain-containing protein [Chitinophaga vietnamensis]|uniref:carboxypeptidase regulatory-like domain-containing protein n=1 Tax=Chitinophaga vietnamensis TaxID=2593957 RepID=UPI0011783DF8|nr:carboxypeptidase regulatory-like domain-containing protein [Chitinophaga vietnamensis]